MKPPTLVERARYRFDSFMAKGGSSIFVSLVLVFMVLFVLLAALRAGSVLVQPDGASPESAQNEEQRKSILRQVYIIFLEMTDPGNMNQDKMASPFMKISGVMAGLVGVVILSTLIAFITTALDQKLSALRKGHSRVIEQGHTLILGWNARVVEILRELVIANESEDDACVVILSSTAKEDMDDFLSVNLLERATTRVVTRSGSVAARHSLDVASLVTSKSVIVLATCSDEASETEKAASDTRVIKTILGAVAAKTPGMTLNIVAELFFDRSRQIALDISPEEVTVIDGSEILAKILVQTSRSVGLSVVYGEALSFDGCEMYFHNGDWPEIEFGKLQFHFPDGVPLGIRTADGKLMINPPVDRIVGADDDVLILAEDDSTIEFREQPVATFRDIPLAGGRQKQGLERELIIGWNEKVPLIIREYSDYVLEGSQIDIMVSECTDNMRRLIARTAEDCPNLTLQLIEEDTLQAESLRAREPFLYDNIIILSSGGDEVDPESTDSETIVILLLLRKIFEEAPDNLTVSTKIITEVMNSENQELVSRAGVNDFIISNRFVSTILAQISEEPDIKRVYDDLFSQDGSEIYLKPAHLYFAEFPVRVTFADMMAIAQKRAEVCLGVKLKSLERDMTQNFGVKLIPEKTTEYELGPEDCLVVISEDET